MGFPRHSINALAFALVSAIGLLLITGCASTPSCRVEWENVSETKKQAEAGDPDAQYQIALWFKHGVCLSQSTSEAMDWFAHSAEQGNSKAQLQLASLYISQKKDTESAIKWYRRAAEKGEIGAYRSLGNIYFYGQGVTRDIDEAERWFLPAAGRGDYQSTWMLEKIWKEKHPDNWEENKHRLAEIVELEKLRAEKEKQRLKENEARELKRFTQERKRLALERFGTINIVWSPPDPELEKERAEKVTKSYAGRKWVDSGTLVDFVILPFQLGAAAVDSTKIASNDRAAHKVLEDVFKEPRIQQGFHAQLIKVTESNINNPVKMIENPLSHSTKIGSDDAETVVMISGFTIGFLLTHSSYSEETGYAQSDQYQLLMGANISLKDTSGDIVLESEELNHHSNRAITLPDWAKDDARLFREALEDGYRSIANQITENILNQASIPEVN